jgi:predicted nicotinamide N-methyase
VALTESVRAFLRDHTRPTAPPLCPELGLHLARDLETIWQALEQSKLPHPASPPYWAVAWPAGLAMARFILDRPEVCRDRSVLDLGSGSGICAIAARLAGARDVAACDWDAVARCVITENARLNRQRIRVLEDLDEASTEDWDVILAADVWYERFSSASINTWLRTRAESDANVILADTRRAYFPRTGLSHLQRVRVISARAEPADVEICRLHAIGNLSSPASGA